MVKVARGEEHSPQQQEGHHGNPSHSPSKRGSNKVTQAKARGNAPANLPGVPPDNPGETAALPKTN